MSKLKCILCDSYNIKKVGEKFICQDCNSEYTLDEIKKIMDVDTKPIKESNNNFLKLEYDLLCWHNFYEKCHELERSFEIKDDLFLVNNDANNTCPQDISEREVSFTKNNDIFFQEKVYPKLKEHYLKNKSDTLIPYYNDAKEKKIVEEKNKTSFENNRISSNNTKKALAFATVILGVVFLIIGIVGFVNHNTSLGWVMLVLSVVTLISSAFIQPSNSSNKLKDSYKIANTSFPTIEEWNKNNIDQLDIFKNYLEESKKDFLDKVNVIEMDIINQIKSIKEIKDWLIANIPLPPLYCDEYKVNRLLALVINKRAETLKEAINLFETENYRSTVIESLNLLNTNLIILNQNILNLRKEIHDMHLDINAGINLLIKSNEFISTQIDSIRFDTRYLMIDNFIS